MKAKKFVTKVRRAGKIVKTPKRISPTVKQKKNLFRWKQEVRGL